MYQRIYAFSQEAGRGRIRIFDSNQSITRNCHCCRKLPSSWVDHGSSVRIRSAIALYLDDFCENASVCRRDINYLARSGELDVLSEMMRTGTLTPPRPGV
jgi:hypothetical protein